MPSLRVGENVPLVTSPTVSPAASSSAMCARGMPRLETSMPRSVRAGPALRSASSASRPQKAGLRHPTAQPERACTG